MQIMLEYSGSTPTTYPEDETYGLISDPIVIIQEVSDERNPFGD